MFEPLQSVAANACQVSSVEPRFNLDKAVRYRALGGKWQCGRTRNVSRSGILLACDESLPVGTIVEMMLLDEDRDGNLVEGQLCCGEVVRFVERGRTEVGTLVALHFLGVEPAETPESPAI